MKRAVVLFNLGGPDAPQSVQPFLFNLFNDKAIIGLPQPLRWLVAKLISTRRAPVAQEIYENLGGKSPLLELTQEQARDLEASLSAASPGDDFKVVIAMRYWHPFSGEAAAQLKAFGPDEITLLPLYPQFSTTTTGSSALEWAKAAKDAGLSAPTRTVCCYPMQDDFITAHAEMLRPYVADGAARVLFSAHGLPKRVVERGDPYQWQVEQTVAATVQALDVPGLDYVTCYQSRVGPLEWIGPSTDDEIERAGREGKPLVVVPIAFVSEHSETLVELDIEYGELAEKAGVPDYKRVPALGTHPSYVAALTSAVLGAVDGVAPNTGKRICPKGFSRCPCDRQGEHAA
ncbi:ferrochelatase [Pyruvatibacter mobilis]|uniref:ferrochelatase n=1 Tax=Pyruvatibacter mobilis TaxID=1712261 RepID=UPI003C7DE173